MIQVRAGWSNIQILFQEYSWTLQQTFAMSKTLQTIYSQIHDSLLSYLLPKYDRMWMVWIILLFGKSKHAKWNTRIILILYGLKPLSINKTFYLITILIIHYLLFQVINFLLELLQHLSHALSMHTMFTYGSYFCEIDQIEHISNHSHFTTPNPFS